MRRRDDEVLTGTAGGFGCPCNCIVDDLIRGGSQVESQRATAQVLPIIDHDGTSEQMIADGIRGDCNSLSFGVKSTLWAPARN